MGCNVHDVLRRIVFYYTKKHKKLKINFLIWFEIVIIFQDETLNLQRIDMFSKIHVYSKVFY
jgi:hypothetical protein